MRQSGGPSSPSWERRAAASEEGSRRVFGGASSHGSKAGRLRLACERPGAEGVSLSDIFARIVALIGAAAILLRRLTSGTHKPTFGSNPAIPAAKRQGIPTLKMPTARG